MAKQDFCFNFYDGDAARDMAHMNRTERGGYMDLIISQRKFGPMEIERIKKTLGSDFEAIWPSIEVVMVQTADGKYYIEWLTNSILKMQAHSGKQSQNGKKGGRKTQKQSEIEAKESQTEANLKPNESQIKPLGNGYENVYESELENKGVQGDGIVPDMAAVWMESYPEYPIDVSTDYPELLQISTRIKIWKKLEGQVMELKNRNIIMLRWGELVKHAAADSHLSTYSIARFNRHFQSIVQSFNTQNNDTGSKTGKIKTVGRVDYQPAGTGGY